MTIASILHEKILAVAPITGVSLGILENKETWKIHFAPHANEKQKEAAYSVIELFDILFERNRENEQDEMEKINKKLLEIDIDSIRIIREWINKNSNPPKELLEKETEAMMIRNRMNRA